MLLLVAMLNAWAFPVKNFLLILSVVMLLPLFFIFKSRWSYVQKAVCLRDLDGLSFFTELIFYPNS
jgi:hypothetical protein